MLQHPERSATVSSNLTISSRVDHLPPKEVKMKALSPIRFLPIFAFSIVIVTFASSYICSVLGYKQYPAALPFISYTGNEAPASCIFTFGLCAATMFTFPVIVLQFYRLNSSITAILANSSQNDTDVETVVSTAVGKNTFPKFSCGTRLTLEKRIRLVNFVACAFGLLSCFGSFLVACFQEKNVAPVHYFGAGMAFLGIVIYESLLSIVFFHVRYSESRRRLFRFRLVLNVICWCFLVVMLTCMRMTHSMKKEGDPIHYRFLPECPYHTLFITASISEWALCILSFLYINTFYYDFKYMALNLEITIHKIPGLVVESVEE